MICIGIGTLSALAIMALTALGMWGIWTNGRSDG